MDGRTQVGSVFGECDGRVDKMKLLLQAGTELVKENVSNFQGRIWALGHMGTTER